MRHRTLRAAALTTALALGACSDIPATLTVTQQDSGTDALLIAVSPVNDKVVWASGANGTFVRSTDGGRTWRPGQVAGAESLQFRDVHAVDSLTAYLLSIGNGPDSRIYKTTDGGTSWSLQFTNPDSAAFFDCFDFWDAQRGLAVSDGVDGAFVVIETEDGGATWTRIEPLRMPSALAGEGSFAASGTCVIARPGGKAWIATKGRVLLTSTYGDRWSVVEPPVSSGESRGIFSLAFRDAQFGAAFVGDAGKRTAASDTLLAVTVDGGVTWVPRTNPPLASGVWAGAHVPGIRALTMVAAGPSGIAWSTDDATTWQMADRNSYWGLAALGPTVMWAVGDSGRIAALRFEGRAK
jgi:photosystem II stability/assembly factor-like uncharacterized protein